MTKKFILSATAAVIMALSGNAIASEVGTNPGQQVVMQASTNPASLELHFTGAQRVMFYDAATLQVTRADGTTWKYRPSFSQDVNGKRKYLVPGFRILGKDRVGISLTKANADAPVLLDGKSPNS